MLSRQIQLERGLLMENIISRIYKLVQETENLIEFEEQVQLLMYETLSNLIGEVFSTIKEVIKEKNKQRIGKLKEMMRKVFNLYLEMFVTAEHSCMIRKAIQGTL